MHLLLPLPSGGRRGRMAAAMLLLCSTLILTPGATGQEDPVAGEVSVEIVSQAVSHTRADRLALGLRISNGTAETLEGFRVVLGTFFRVQTRSDLASAFDLSLREAPGSLPLDFLGRDIAPGGTEAIEISTPLDEVPVLAGALEPGVYPLKVTVQDEIGLPLASASTQLLFYPEEQETSLTLVPMVPIAPIPTRGPDGVFRPSPEGLYPLEEALQEDGWLRGLAEALDAATAAGGRIPGLRLGVAPGPRLLEELEDMADGYHREEAGEVIQIPGDDERAEAAGEVLDLLTDVLGRPNVQIVLTPYAFPDLPNIAEDGDVLRQQIAVGDSVLQQVLGTSVDNPWIYAPGGRLDGASIQQLRTARIEHSFFSPDALAPVPDPDRAGCPVETLTLACPIAVETSSISGELTGYRLDPELQAPLELLDEAGVTRLQLQRFFAQTSMIREEQPGDETRVIVAELPATWQGEPWAYRRFLQGLRRAPWLTTARPDEGLQVSEAPAERSVVQSASPQPGQLSTEYMSRVAQSQRVVDSFGSIGPPPVLHQRLARDVLVAYARHWWGDGRETGLDFALDAENEATKEMNKIGVVAPPSTTFTSRRGELQMIVFNDTGYEVSVLVRVNSPGLSIGTKNLRVDIGEEQRSLSLDVTARSSGIFPLEITITTPDGGYAIYEHEPVAIRSTELNEIALAVTVGAAAFLLLFYVYRRARRRRNTPAESSPA